MRNGLEAKESRRNIFLIGSVSSGGHNSAQDQAQDQDLLPCAGIRRMVRCLLTRTVHALTRFRAGLATVKRTSADRQQQEGSE